MDFLRVDFVDKFYGVPINHIVLDGEGNQEFSVFSRQSLMGYFGL